mmetsp:Transcript_11140/g.29637  ORF Transcript_11140/g.29637 Transcript_11140/m.29637 type:complete len:232 (-) Transcript_11140:1033-1728(-)
MHDVVRSCGCWKHLLAHLRGPLVKSSEPVADRLLVDRRLPHRGRNLGHWGRHRAVVDAVALVAARNHGHDVAPVLTQSRAPRAPPRLLALRGRTVCGSPQRGFHIHSGSGAAICLSVVRSRLKPRHAGKPDGVVLRRESSKGIFKARRSVCHACQVEGGFISVLTVPNTDKMNEGSATLQIGVKQLHAEEVSPRVPQLQAGGRRWPPRLCRPSMGRRRGRELHELRPILLR